MANVIDLEESTTSTEIEETTVEVPTSGMDIDIHGPWDDESIPLAKRVELITETVTNLENDSIVRRYEVAGGEETGNELKKFIKDKAKWKFTDAFLLVNLSNEIDQALKECRKTNKFEISGIYINTIVEILQSAEGVGYHSAKAFYDNILLPFSNVVNKYREDSTKLQSLTLKKGALESQLESELKGDVSDSGQEQTGDEV